MNDVIVGFKLQLLLQIIKRTLKQYYPIRCGYPVHTYTKALQRLESLAHTCIWTKTRFNKKKNYTEPPRYMTECSYFPL